jgi:undecaprenyl-diphosphatase
MEAFIFRAINDLALKNTWLDTFGLFFAIDFPYILTICLLMLLVFNYKKYRLVVLQSFLAGFLARGIAEFIRLFIDKPRPFVENQVNFLHFKSFIEDINSRAFPSGHASFFFAISFVLFLYNKKLGIVFFTASSAIALARIYCGIHWPLDMVGGLIVGIFSGIIVLGIFKKIKKIDNL